MTRDSQPDFDLEEEDDDDPNDPRHRDYDLSESAPYDFDSWADDRPWYLRRWAMLLVSIALIFSMVVLPAYLVFSRG